MRRSGFGEKRAGWPSSHSERSSLDNSERRSVLVVDDEPALRDVLFHELADEYDVVTAPGVEEALEILGRRKDFVAVVSDLVMRGPDDGYVLLEAVRLIIPRCARVLVSGTSEGDWFVKNGTAQRFVGKPWRKGAVLAALGEVVR